MTDASHELYRETEAAKVLLMQIADIVADDDQLAADMVEAETNINEAIDHAVQRLALDFAAMRGLDAMIDDLRKRRDRAEKRIENMRTALAVAMEQAGRKKIERPAVTLSLRSVPPSVVVTEEGDIPSVYWEPQAPKLNKRALLKALKEIRDIPGATLSNGGQTLALKWS